VTQPTPDHSPAFFPVLRYRDAPAAIDFLVAAFGFERRMVTPGPDGAIAHAEFGLGRGAVLLGSLSPGETGAPTGDERTAAFGIYVALPDVDAHCARARAAGATIERGPEATDYGSREYTARDPEGYLWSFGSYWPDPARRADSSG